MDFKYWWCKSWVSVLVLDIKVLVLVLVLVLDIKVLVLVLVLEPQSLGLGLGEASLESKSARLTWWINILADLPIWACESKRWPRLEVWNIQETEMKF